MNVNKWTAPSAAMVLMMAAIPTMAQNSIIPLDTLVANHGSIAAGPLTFSNFQKPTLLPSPMVGTFLGEFNDVGVTANANADGTVSLGFVMIDPATGLASPIIVGGNGVGEFVRLLSYSVTVTDPVLRMHSVSQTFGPATNVTGSSMPYTMLYGVEPVWAPDPLRTDTWNTSSTVAPWESLLPGGNLPAYNMENEFGVIKGHLGFPAGAVLDSFSVNFTLVPAGTPVPPVVVNLGQRYAPFTSTLVTDGFTLDPNSGAGGIYLDNFAQDGGATITLTSDNPAALALPPSITIPQGYKLSAPIVLGPPTVDFPTDVNLTASFNGRSTTHVYTAVPPTPLAITQIWAYLLPCTSCASSTVWVTPSMNRPNISSETIALASSNPAVCPIQTSLTLAPLTPVDFNRLTVTCKLVPVDTPVTFSGTFNGATVSMGIVVPHVVDSATITKAELVVKNLSLKVDATSSVPTAVLTLYDAATGQSIGTMTNTGLSGGGAKYSYQGTVPSKVLTLRVKSSFNGTSTFAVAQK